MKFHPLAIVVDDVAAGAGVVVVIAVVVVVDVAAVGVVAGVHLVQSSDPLDQSF